MQGSPRWIGLFCLGQTNGGNAFCAGLLIKMQSMKEIEKDALMTLCHQVQTRSYPYQNVIPKCNPPVAGCRSKNHHPQRTQGQDIK